jgi:hypothetical protein
VPWITFRSLPLEFRNHLKSCYFHLSDKLLKLSAPSGNYQAKHASSRPWKTPEGRCGQKIAKKTGKYLDL